MYLARIWIVCLIVCLGLPVLASGQGLGTDDTLTAQKMVERLLGGGLVTINETYVGASGAAGAFYGGTGIVGFEKGIILSSGYIESVIGPNLDDATTMEFGTAGDTDLDALVPEYLTKDAAILEFDVFIPKGINTIAFRYVFTSEEYNEWTGSPFTNIFGFFVNGKNYALLPDGVTPVSINTVNGGHPDTCSDGFDNDEDGLIDMVEGKEDPDCMVPLDNIVGEDNSNSDFFINNDCDDLDGGTTACPIDIAADGLTVVLDFVAPVNSEQYNHIKLGIADVSDALLDSWVFIEAGSLTGGIQEHFDPGENRSQDFKFDVEKLIVNVTFDEVTDPDGFDLTLIALEVGQNEVNGRLGDPFYPATCLPIAYSESDCVIIHALNPPSPNPQYTGGFDMTIKYLERYPPDGTNPRMVHAPGADLEAPFTEDITVDYYPEAVPGADGRIRGFTDNWSDFLTIDAAALEKCTVYGFDPPIDSSTFNVGQTIPVKFNCITDDGTMYTDAIANLSLSMIVNDVGEPQPVQPAGTSNLGNEFRLAGSKYIYNLKTTGLAPGIYHVTASSADFVPVTAEFELVGKTKTK